MTAPTDPVTRARQLLDAATPGPWEMSEVEATAPHWLTDVFVTDADLGEPVAQILVLDHPDYEVWQPRADANAELIAAAPQLIADLCDIIDRLTQWKAEGTEVIESWELVYDALGDVGGLGQRRSDAVLAEVLRMKAELDQRTNPDLATLLVKNADRYDKRFGWETPMGEQMRAAARMIGDTP